LLDKISIGFDESIAASDFCRILDKASPMASGAIKSSLLIELGFG
jgi:hypothetical protein